MTDEKTPEEKIAELEQEEVLWMEQLYAKAKELVIQENNAAISFLQKKLWIDFMRAKKLLAMMEAEGIVGPSAGGELRKVRTKK